MSLAISQEEWSRLPLEAQRELEDFFIFIKNKYLDRKDLADTAIMSENSLAKDWLKPEEDEAWVQFQKSSL